MAVCCSVVYCVATNSANVASALERVDMLLLQCVAVCCSVFQCVSVCCSVLQCVVMCCNEFSERC